MLHKASSRVAEAEAVVPSASCLIVAAFVAAHGEVAFRLNQHLSCVCLLSLTMVLAEQKEGPY